MPGPRLGPAFGRSTSARPEHPGCAPAPRRWVRPASPSLAGWFPSGCCRSIAAMAEKGSTLRTRKFITNRLLARKQFVSAPLRLDARCGCAACLRGPARRIPADGHPCRLPALPPAAGAGRAAPRPRQCLQGAPRGGRMLANGGWQQRGHPVPPCWSAGPAALRGSSVFAGLAAGTGVAGGSCREAPGSRSSWSSSVFPPGSLWAARSQRMCGFLPCCRASACPRLLRCCRLSCARS